MAELEFGKNATQLILIGLALIGLFGGWYFGRSGEEIYQVISLIATGGGAVGLAFTEKIGK